MTTGPRFLSVAFTLLAVMSLSLPGFAAEPAADDSGVKQPPKGFRSLILDDQLSNWRGQIDEYPSEIAKITKGMTAKEIEAKQLEADKKTMEHWKVKDGVIHYDGTRRIGNIETREHFGDFEMYIDWKIPKGGDSGIFPRNMPQIQIWDPRNSERAAVGSGGLDNNGPKPMTSTPPSTKADKPVNQWNTFHIKMIGDKVWVTLNGTLVVDGKVKGNFWKQFKEPAPKTGPIVLQSHGSDLWFRNIFIRSLDTK